MAHCWFLPETITLLCSLVPPPRLLLGVGELFSGGKEENQTGHKLEYPCALALILNLPRAPWPSVYINAWFCTLVVKGLGEWKGVLYQ